jgi:protein O-mannosyl-transferase
MRVRGAATAAAVFALLLATYANHFRNGFHFDDDHTIVNNAFVRDVAHIPRYFTDATTSSILPANQSYRPVLQTTLAIDYWIAGGYHPLAFQIDTFVWFVLQLGCMWWLFARIASLAGGDATFAALPTAIYALHPVCAETVNYIIQRGDIISTCGVVGGLAMYAGAPKLRRSLLYLVPVAGAILAKPPAMVFPLLLLAYESLIARRSLGQAVRASAPSLALVVALAVWSARHTPPSFTSGGGSAAWYWLTQTFVAARYFGAFFAPIGLSADNDWRLLESIADVRAVVGVAFIVALVWAIARTARRPDTCPAAFGLAWFLIALLPTSIVPLAEVANDHRMFFPFVGLSLAVCWMAMLWWRTSPVSATAARRGAAAAILAVVIALEVVGVRARNVVWRTDDSLWYDVTIKSPTNGRGLMNYGLTRMAEGDYATATTYFERALAFTPNYSLLHINLGIAYGGAGRLVDAEREFQTAIRLAPDDWRSHFYYGRWLRQIRRGDDALAELELAARENPADLETARELEAARATPPHAAPYTPEGLLARSLAAYRGGRFRECIDLASAALKLRPGYAEAYNNVAAGHIALGEWDAGIAAAEEALRLNPNLAIARNNIAYARQRKQQRDR